MVEEIVSFGELCVFVKSSCSGPSGRLREEIRMAITEHTDEKSEALMTKFLVTMTNAVFVEADSASHAEAKARILSAAEWGEADFAAEQQFETAQDKLQDFVDRLNNGEKPA